jgi:hypothetical protein
LAEIGDPASAAPLAAHADDRNAKAWIAKADAMARFGKSTSSATPAVVARLDDPAWQVRLTACRTLVKMGDERAVEPLIERLEREGGRLQKEIWLALKAVSYESFGVDPRPWRSWWKSQKPQGLPPPPPVLPKNPEDERYAPPPRRPGSTTPFEEATYYGRRIYSKSVLFVLDLSLSMQTAIDVPRDAQAKLGTIPSGPRILVAKTAVKSAIAKLDPRALFDVVFFSTVVRPWKGELVLVGPARDAALSAVEAAGLEEETNIFGALKAAVGLHGIPTLTPDLRPSPDTIYFLTDGTPTRGEITEKEALLSWMRDVNRFAKVDLHVIAMGSLGLDLPFLSRLAAENHGEFIHVPDGTGAK